MDKVLTKNGVIDAALKEGNTTEQVIELVLKTFPTAEVRSLKRQIYSRRHEILRKEHSSKINGTL